MTRLFRLVTVENLRSREVDRAARCLGDSRRSMLDAEASLASLRAQLDACVPGATATPSDMTAAAARREALRDLEGRAIADVERLRAALESATGGWRAARADLRAVEALHDKHRAAVAAQDARREQLLTDDLASVMRSFPGLGRPMMSDAFGGHGNGPGSGGDAA